MTWGPLKRLKWTEYLISSQSCLLGYQVTRHLEGSPAWGLTWLTCSASCCHTPGTIQTQWFPQWMWGFHTWILDYQSIGQSMFLLLLSNRMCDVSLWRCTAGCEREYTPSWCTESAQAVADACQTLQYPWTPGPSPSQILMSGAVILPSSTTLVVLAFFALYTWFTSAIVTGVLSSVLIVLWIIVNTLVHVFLSKKLPGNYHFPRALLQTV